MSSSRRTAFARVPRNAGNSAAGNTSGQQIIKIDKSYLERLTQCKLEGEMSTILTEIGGRLSIDIGANGRGNYEIVSKSGSPLADAEDIQKIQNLGSFINEERKTVLKNSVSETTRRFLAAIVAKSIEPSSNFAVVHFPRHFLDAYRAIKNQMDLLGANVASIQALSAEGTANEIVRSHLINTATKIRSVTGSYIQYRASLSDTDVPEKLNPRLMNGGVMMWVYSRLTNQKMTFGEKDFEFRRIYFPKDPTKGLSISFSEFNSERVRDTQQGILSGCRYAATLWTWEKTRVLLGFDKVKLDFEEAHKAFSNVPLLVVPFPQAVKAEELLATLGKSGDRGFPWSAGNTTKPQDIIRFLGTIPKRALYAQVTRPSFKKELLSGIFPGFNVDDTESGVYSALAAQAKAGTITDVWVDRVSEGTLGERMTECYLSIVKDLMDYETCSFGHKVVIKLVVVNDLIASTVQQIESADVWGALSAMTGAITEARSTELLKGKVDPDWFTRKKKVKETDLRRARTILTPAGTELLSTMRTRHYGELSMRVDNWLRSFMTTDIQSVVAKTINARLSAYLSAPVVYAQDDRVGILTSLEVDWTEELSEPEIVGGQSVVNPDD